MLRRQTVGWFTLALLVSLSWTVSGASPEVRKATPVIASLEANSTRIDWRPLVEYERLALTVSGPGDLFLHHEFGPGQAPHFDLGEAGRLPDGVYAYELRCVSSKRALVQSGYFFIQGGSFVTASPEPSLRKVTENLTDDDLIIQGYACIGEDCATTDDDTPVLKLKGQSPNILFDDIDPLSLLSSSFNDWAISINDSDIARFSIVDVEGGLTPFSISGGAPSNSLFVRDNGNVGLGTMTPGTRLDVKTNLSGAAVARLQNSSSTGTSATEYLDNNGTVDLLFGIDNATSTTRLNSLNNNPITLLTNSVERMRVTSGGNVGIGTPSPSQPLHVRRVDGTARILVEEAAGTASSRVMLQLQNNGGIQLQLADTSLASTWSVNNISGSLRLVKVAAGVTAFDLQGNGNLTIDGALTQGSDRNNKREIVPVQPDDILDRVLSLPIATWSSKLDKSKTRHLGPMAQDFAAAFGLGADDRHIAPLDAAGVGLASVQALHGKMATALAERDEEIEALRRENSDLAQRLATLEKLVLTLVGEASNPQP